MRNFEVSSGGFSGAVVVVGISDSDDVEGAVEAEESWKDPDEAEAMTDCTCGNVLERKWECICKYSCGKPCNNLSRSCCCSTKYRYDVGVRLTCHVCLAVTFWIAIRAGGNRRYGVPRPR
jgi:hypothetical protein